MLQRINDKTKQILDLADFIDNLRDHEFSMKSWGTPWGGCHCICGWLLQSHGFWAMDDWKEAADRLGIDDATAIKLFSSDNKWNQHQAASVLRHLAVTGELPKERQRNDERSTILERDRSSIAPERHPSSSRACCGTA